MSQFWPSLLSLALAASTTNQFIHPSVDSGKCLTAASNSDGAPVTISDCITTGDASSQSWTTGSGTLVLYGNKCLDVTGGVAASGTRLQIWTCTTNDANQAWSTGGASGSITWNGPDWCLDLTKGADADGTVVCLFPV
ncbi:ricin B lectin domain-containing protein [Roridomyces roridus]|uniref:Ricin B lectin domain-containing protein n=1 Tax=Roridomyces roridus TaxID=1738132 RepID=A0AAD7BZI8_9AGAR|nr:ricin B lectin domain-containing protein [Roridomyces roridus]